MQNRVLSVGQSQSQEQSFRAFSTEFDYGAETLSQRMKVSNFRYGAVRLISFESAFCCGQAPSGFDCIVLWSCER